MENIEKMGLVKLNEAEATLMAGGLVIAHFQALAEAFHWAYTEFKKGVNDGYNSL